MRRILIALGLVAGLGGPASAATVPYRTDAELVALATRVVRGRVLDSVAERAPGGTVRTRTRLAVIEDFTGGADRVITIYELGGVLADGSGMSVPGAPRFAQGEEVVLCLERAGDGFRTVALGYSAFRVAAATAGSRLTRIGGDLGVVGRPRGAEPARTLDAFRATAITVTGVRARLVVSDAEAAAMVQAAPVQAPFTLLGGGIRWQEADSAVAINWYRNTITASPVQAGDTDAEIARALQAWTEPPTASIILNFAGTRSAQPGPDPEPFCTADNLGVGLITFGDPRNELPVGVLAVGGGCVSSVTHVVNGQAFRRFTHGFVVFNDALSGFTAPPNITRILEHEVGHGIGLGHTCQGECVDADAANIMYPACCLAITPVPPAIGPDDLAGLNFIYPRPQCTIVVEPSTTSVGAIGGDRSVAVTPSLPSCAWSVSSMAAWIIVTSGASGTGAGIVRFTAAPSFGSFVQRSGTILVGATAATVVQAADTDADGDGLSDAWETLSGLDPTSNLGDEGALGDADHDGVLNRDEFTAGTHPRGTVQRYLAEGVANAFFDTEIALFNPSPLPATVLLRIQPEGGSEVAWAVSVPGTSRRTVSSPIFRSLSGAPFATLIESDRLVVVDRTMRWDANGYGAHAETAVEAPATTWYLAEGSTSAEFSLFYLLQNPGPTATLATVRFLRPSPQPPIDRSYTLAPHARLTIPVDTLGPELSSTDVSAVVTASQPIIVERAMYRDLPGQPFAAGHESAGVTAPATEWFLAEGATGTFFDLFVLIENPGATAAAVRVDYLLPSGSTLSKTYAIAAQSRFTIYVDDEQIPAGSGQRPLASTAVSMRITSTNAVPIIVERAMWWPQPVWYEAHNAPGTTVTGTSWAMAAGYVGGPTAAETYVLIANTADTAGEAGIAIFFEDGTNISTTVSLPAHSRTNVPIGVTFPSAAGRRFGTIVASVTPGLPIVVERAMYDSPGGVTWAAGTAAVATRITP